MKPFAKWIAAAAFRSGLPDWYSRLIPRCLTVLAYHRLRASPARTSEFDDAVFGPTVDEFREQMTWLSENWDLLGEEDLLAILRGERSAPRRGLVVTFDDGYRDNYELAVPILRMLGVPAIFFAPTRLIESRELGWWDQIAYAAKRTRLNKIHLAGQCLEVTEDRRALAARCQRAVKSGRWALSERFSSEVAEVFAVDPPSREAQSAELMTWDHLRELCQPPFAIGSHTHRHWILSRLSLLEQREEFARSKGLLESLLGRPIVSLAYPVGRAAEFQPQTKRLAAECGYQLAFSFRAGLNLAATFEPFEIHRLHPPRAVPVMGTALAFPSLYHAYRSHTHDAA